MIREPQTHVIMGGYLWDINYECTACLDILVMLADEELQDRAKAIALIKMFYVDWEEITMDLQEEAIDHAIAFLSIGGEEKEEEDEEENTPKKPRLVDWDKDQDLYINPINKAYGKDLRISKDMHFWTFMSYYREIGECLFTQVTAIREKLATNKKLEKHEKEFYSRNRKMIDINYHMDDDSPDWLKDYC